MKYIIVASALAATASAAFSLTDFPQCSLDCVMGGKVQIPSCVEPATPSSPKSVECLCSKPDGVTFQEGMNTCVTAPGACNAADQCKLYNLVKSVCGGTPLHVAAPAGCNGGSASPPVASQPPAGGQTSAPPAAGGANSPHASSTEEAPVSTSSAVASETPSSSAGGSYGAPASSTVATSASVTANSTSAPVASEIAVGAASANVFNGAVALVAGLFVALVL